MKFVRNIGALIALAASAGAQSATYTIGPFAGSSHDLGDGGPATSALLWSPRGIAADAAGNLYIADTSNARVRRVAPGGIIATIAGGDPGFSGDGASAAVARLSFPSKIAAAPNGDLYIADTANHRVRKISAAGVITTVAGTGAAAYGGDDGPATLARLSSPGDVAVDANGNLYIADTNNMRIRRVSALGVISTVAGLGSYGSRGDGGPAVSASLASPRGVAVDAAGNLYIADTANHRVRKVSTDGIIATVSGSGTPGYSGDSGAAGNATLNSPAAVALDRQANLYIADSGNNRIRRITPQGTISTVAGSGTAGFGGDGGPAASAMLNSPQGVAVDPSGNLYVADTANHRVRMVTPQGIVKTVAGSDSASGDGGPATRARLLEPSGLAIDAAGTVYISDTSNNRIRRVTRQGLIDTIAGNGLPGYSGDSGPAISAQLNGPTGLAVVGNGDLFIADTGNHVIRRFSGGGISTVAGTGDPGRDGDLGQATAARLFHPSAVAFDSTGSMFIADSGNNRVRVVSRGVIRAYAGDPAGFPGFSGDGGPGSLALFDYPIALAVNSAGDVYVADYFNNRIRLISGNGSLVTTFAGTGESGGGGDNGPASQAQLRLPAGIAFDSNRNLYVADLLNSRIRAIGANGVIRSIAGTGAFGNSGDGGNALAATLASPRDVAVDPGGSVYFTDQDNQRVRKLTPSSVSIHTVVNAASGIAGPVAPGEAVSIFGSQLGPVVTFDGIPARLLYVSASQVNVIVPDGLAGRTLANMRVENGDLGADTFGVTVREASPGIFTLDSSGSGPGAVINQDGTVNSVSNPAPRGTIVAIYGTGQGTLNTAAVRIQGIQAEILFNGQTQPGLYQVNARVPADAFTLDRTPVELSVGAFAAQPGVTIAIR